MSQYYSELSDKVTNALAEIESVQATVAYGELTIEVSKENLLQICQTLRDNQELAFDTIIDICGVDYSTYECSKSHTSRFASVYHLLSVKNNHRIRVRTWLDDDFPVVDSVVSVWNGANWFERESFDLLGILYSGHPDLRRILTDYGFIGHPLRKDFPMVGQVEMRYDANKQRVIYEPVTLEERVTIPRIIRDDNRYAERLSNKGPSSGDEDSNSQGESA
ncbi:MAG: NADH-quinone oxidoreductase subunit C [gamma proteobacterium symbiont of Bathyaustriella thionipta]|nr:NADH-quinone oxidoreductase subunit C [gamma proteobacterium symbiont of Bathyaustriella thionipta]MCU7948856.1 NADH-quinone oxidoreductase subunit C [gamma proteobacterium symbiont of Bathyaustriella thionipta]MCU7951935.1 NADH-quinone oxidoreductase subunit C [gamma proteobacterium symbiont of Bathyaustriella thionipta]MCU7955430.1 NADH-quinone oxidoreductase subunit C [gamma proteobacterium symbiont of Bathyaustriella thionipta]MCU7965753.1 NADH-quinone oxidoreductase subunit C [gamma pro